MTSTIDRPAVTTKRPRTPAVRAASAGRGAAYHLVSGLLALAFLFPLLWAFLGSVRGPNPPGVESPWLPATWTMDNYINLATYGEGLWVYVWNSVVLAALTVGGTVVICVMAGYGFARFQFRGKGALFAATLAILMVPYATILLPLYLILGVFGLQNSVVGLSLALIMFQLPFGVFMMRNSFESIPRELEEAALVDGCSNVGALRHVSLRIVTPGIVTVALFSFLASWNDFLAPLIFLNDGRSYTLPIMLVNIRSGAYGNVDFGALQAGVIVAIVPCLVLYLFLQRYYVSGLVNGALRG